MKLDCKKILGQIMHTKQLVIILLVGIGLLVLPGLFHGRAGQKPMQNDREVSEWLSYETELEERLETILSTLRGVSQVSVMITLEDEGEIYYARNESADIKNTTDGMVQEDNRQSDGTLALKNDAGGGQSPVKLKMAKPRISGVLVTAKGAENISVQMNVMNAVRAVLDVPAHKVQVLEKE